MSRVCPHCLNGELVEGKCSNCPKSMRLIHGVPSTTNTITTVDYDRKLKQIIRAHDGNLDMVFSEIRETDMDGSVVDRFFQSRTVNWRILVDSYLTGRGLVIGQQDEKVGILLGEVLNEVHTVSTSPKSLRAQTKVAESRETTLHPLHAELDTLPFPSASFDVIVINCRSYQIDTYLSELSEYLSEGGALLLLVDGWTRELGVTKFVGMGEGRDGIYNGIASLVYGHAAGIRRAVRESDLHLTRQFALLSTDDYENERSFDIQSRQALNWLLNKSPTTTAKTSFHVARLLARCAQNIGILNQSYPRYLSICRPEEVGSDRTRDEVPTDSILISGDARSTLLEFDKNKIHKIRKVPNDKRMSVVNKNASKVEKKATGRSSKVIPTAEHVWTKFGLERHEKPVTGTPLDTLLDSTPSSVREYLNIVFDWLIAFQNENITDCVYKNVEDINEDISIERATEPILFSADGSVELPTVIVHGDLFGSNIYIQNQTVQNVIDWEFSQIGGNPIADAGYFLLQMADYIGDGFKNGFEKLFLSDSEYSSTVYSQIEQYCSAVGIDQRAFVIYLPIGYINHAKRHFQYSKRLEADFIERINYVYNNHSKLIQVMDIK